jgi:hypothetical protein
MHLSLRLGTEARALPAQLILAFLEGLHERSQVPIAEGHKAPISHIQSLVSIFANPRVLALHIT